jgi:ABC-type sugar transport system substrate-binding protein
MRKVLAGSCAIVLLWGLIAGFGGCARSEPDSSSPRKIRMAGIIFQEDQFFRLILLGMRDAAKKNGVELLEGNSDNKPEKELQLVQTYTAQKVDAVLISPLSKAGSVNALRQANEKGVIVVTNNTSIDADFPAGDVECSAYDLGEQTGKAARKYIEEKLGGKANIAILAFKSQVAEQSDARTGGFKSQVTQLPGVKIVAEQDAWLSDMAVKKAGDMLIANPDIDIIFAANEGGTAGSVLAVRNAGKAGKIAVFGTDVSEQLLGFLQSSENILQAITAQRPFEVGQQSVEVALKALRKEPHEKKVTLTGVCLTRSDSAGVEAYAKQLKQWTSGN